MIVTQDHTAANEKPRILHLADRLLWRLSDRIISVSDFDRSLLRGHEGVPSEKVVAINNGIKPARFDPPLG